MNLYLISQTKNNDWDTFDSAIVAANSADEARWIHPATYVEDWDGTAEEYSTWVCAKDVNVKLIGKADKSITQKGVILASFNAG